MILGRLLCLLGRHDWEPDVETSRLESEPGTIVIHHYDDLFPETWECQRCGAEKHVALHDWEPVETTNSQ